MCVRELPQNRPKTIETNMIESTIGDNDNDNARLAIRIDCIAFMRRKCKNPRRKAVVIELTFRYRNRCFKVFHLFFVLFNHFLVLVFIIAVAFVVIVKRWIGRFGRCVQEKKKHDLRTTEFLLNYLANQMHTISLFTSFGDDRFGSGSFGGAHLVAYLTGGANEEKIAKGNCKNGRTVAASLDRMWNNKLMISSMHSQNIYIRLIAQFIL